MSIFTKDCPQCAETNAAYAVRCKCGFAFNADDGADSQTEEEIAAEEEKLYQEYLAARARQASGTTDDATRLAAPEAANQSEPKEAEQAAAKGTQAAPKEQTTGVVDSTTERKHAKVEPPAAPAVAQIANVKSVSPAPKPPAAKPPVQGTTAPEGTAEPKHAKAAPLAAPAVGQIANVKSASPAPKPAVQQTTVPAATTQIQAPKAPAEAKQSWLISGAESDAQSDATTPPPAVKPAAATPAKPATNNARPTPTAANVDAAKMSAAERAKKLQERLKEVQAKRGSNTTTTGASATSKINTSAGAAKPNPDSARVTTTRPPTAPAAATPATPQTTIAPKTDDTSAPTPSKPTSSAPDTKPDQPQTADKTTPTEPKKVNGSDTAAPASDTIQVPATKQAVDSPKISATAKADLEAALQALHTQTPETNPAISTPTEDGNGPDQADAVPEETIDTGAHAPLGDLTSSLGCTDKECPNCTALVAIDADRCGCGFAFPTEEDAMPSLSLTDSDVEALEKRKKSSGISHLR